MLVNNAGFAVQARFEEVTDGEWDSMWQLNVMSYVRAIRAALPHLRESRGSIVNVSSTAGKRPSVGMPHYSVSKAAVLSLSRLVADAYAGDGIRCNAVTPGPTATDAWLGEGGLADQQGGQRDEVLAKVGAGRPARPARGAGGDRGRDRLPRLSAGLVRHRRRLVAPTAAPSRSSSSLTPCRSWPDESPTPSRRASARPRRARSRRSPSAPTRRAGRLREEEACGIRTPFQRDRDRIVHSKPFRRLKGKTQVFIDPAGDHYRTRITHTLETTGIARVVARALRLNEDLTEAIGLGHDTGHPPFGHAGEDQLDRCLRERFGTGFRHNEQSLRIAEELNLTAEVRDGILTHTGEQEPQTLEGKIVRLVDRVAYINHDIDDAIRWGLLTPDDLPRAELELLGDRGSTRIDTLVHDLIESSEARRRHRPERGGRDGDALAPVLHVRARLPRRARPRRARPGLHHDYEDLRSPGRARRLRGGDPRLHLRDDRPLRAVVR